MQINRKEMAGWLGFIAIFCLFLGNEHITGNILFTCLSSGCFIIVFLLRLSHWKTNGKTKNIFYLLTTLLMAFLLAGVVLEAREKL